MNIVENPPFPSVFGPLGKNYCFYFYILAFLGFFFLILSIVVSLYIGIIKNRGIEFYFQSILIAITYGIFYLQSRLLYNMCTKSL